MIPRLNGLIQFFGGGQRYVLARLELDDLTSAWISACSGGKRAYLQNARTRQANFVTIPKLDFIEKYPASPSRLDVKDWFLPEDFVGPFKGEPEASEVSECTPAFPHVGPVEQLEAV